MPNTLYYVFTNKLEGWFDDFSAAKAQYLEWADRYGCARLYRELLHEDEGLDTEECLEATGEYPM